ncbi:MAG: ParB/RepB/Spo0J family partition protein [Armatimonadota bacterium]
MSVPAQRVVPIADLVLLPELSPRARLCEETVIRYMESFPSLPPPRIQAKTNVVIDGYHRVEAAIRLGMEQLLVNEEPIPDEDLRLQAGVANAAHGQPLTRAERNTLAVALVSQYGKLREEVARLLGMSPSAVTLALREHQYNEMLSEKLGSTVQVINSAHVRALYRVGPEQRERLLEAVVSKVDDDGQPYPLTGAELKLLVDRMLDPATPSAELNRLLNDPKARPKAANPTTPPAVAPIEAGPTTNSDDPFVEESGGSRPWEREWESPLKGGDTEAFERTRAVDEEIERAGGGVDERQVRELLRRAEDNAQERGDMPYSPFWGSADEPAPGASGDRVRDGVYAASKALEELVPQIQPEEVRRQVEAVVALLKGLA